MTKLMIVWDYDTPIARITATKPYNYRFEACLQEEENIEYILRTAQKLDAKFTFATLGYGAEKSVAPFDVRHVIRKIYEEGHEIASHSWKHEWLPYLTQYQLDKTIERSKYILEECVGEDYRVNGFVLPHDRPMSWYSRLAFSAGDRAIYPIFPGASIDGVADSLKKHDYKWIRVNYRSVWQKLIDWRGENFRLRVNRNFIASGGFHYIPEHAMEFGVGSLRALEWAIQNNRPLVIAGHPGAFSFKKQNLDDFNRFIETAVEYMQQGKVKFVTVSDYLNLETRVYEKV